MAKKPEPGAPPPPKRPRGRPRKHPLPEGGPPKKPAKAPAAPGKRPYKRRGPRKPPPPPPPADTPLHLVPLDDDERRFVEEWAVDRNRTLAYLRAFPGNGYGYREGRVRAAEMAGRPHVRHEMECARAAQRARSHVGADLALEEICHVAFSDVNDVIDPQTGLARVPRQIPLGTRKAISKIKVSRERRYEINDRTRSTRTIVTETVIEYQFWNKLDALHRLCEHLGLKTAPTPLDALLKMLPPGAAAALASAISPDKPARIAAPVPVAVQPKESAP